MRLNIACGSNVFPLPWLNTDHVDLEDGTHPEEPKRGYLWHMRRVAERGDDVSTWPEEQRRLVEHIAAGRIRFFQWDLRRGFPMYADGSVEACYLGQCAEHLNLFSELPALLKECSRLLRPGGRVRITTPDLTKLLRAYNDRRMGDFADEQPAAYRAASPAVQLSMLMFGASGPGCTQERYEGHFMCLTVSDMCDLLRQAGLEPEQEGPERSELFSECRDFGLSHSMALEARKP